MLEAETIANNKLVKIPDYVESISLPVSQKDKPNYYVMSVPVLVIERRHTTKTFDGDIVYVERQNPRIEHAIFNITVEGQINLWKIAKIPSVRLSPFGDIEPLSYLPFKRIEDNNFVITLEHPEYYIFVLSWYGDTRVWVFRSYGYVVLKEKEKKELKNYLIILAKINEDVPIEIERDESSSCYTLKWVNGPVLQRDERC